MIALVGDGAMQMNGLAELITIAKYRERWSDQRLIVMVLNNRDLNQVTWEQRAMSGDPKFVESQELPGVPYAQWAQLLGLNGIRTDDPDADRGECWDRRAREPRCRPVLRRSCSDPEVPPLPPHITIEQARSFALRLSGTATPPAGRSSRRRSARSYPGPAQSLESMSWGALRNVRRGRLQRTLSAATALQCTPTRP